jgi:hypothetical protein
VRSGTRLAVAAFLTMALVCAGALMLFVQNACATDLPSQSCPEAGLNRAVVVSLVGLTAALTVTPFAFLAEFAVRRRIVYRGSWGRAMRRGLLVGLGVAAFAGLRVGGALTVPAALFVLFLAALAEWFAVRRFDRP